MERYIRKFVPGEHYVISHNELSSKEYAVVCVNDEAKEIGWARIAEAHVGWLFENNFKLTEINERGFRNFLVPEPIFDSCIDSFILLQDLWIEEKIQNTLDMKNLF